MPQPTNPTRDAETNPPGSIYSYGGVRQIKIEWTETTRRVALMTPDEIRDGLGLGGTADDDLHARLIALAGWGGATFDAAEPHSAIIGTHGRQLQKLDDLEIGEY